MKKKYVNMIGISFFAILITYSYIQSKKDEKILREKGVISKATITGYNLTKSTLLIAYSFEYDYTYHTNSKSAKALESKDVNKYLTNKSFPLIFLPNDPDNNALLIFKEDFERYNLAYPDSLRWVCDSLKLKDCK